jgi:putative tryptophan/tyrosine transport system substrate-binding protein
MRLIGLAVVLILGVCFTPRPVQAEPGGKIPRIAFISTTSPPGSPAIEAFRSAMRDLGYVENQNIMVEWRWGYGTTERFAEFAAEAVRMKVDVIVAANSPAGHAAQVATKTIPIVIATMVNPVEEGFIKSFPRPGGNITGLTLRASELQGKRLQLFKEAVPNISPVAALVEIGFGRTETTEVVATAARVLGVRLQPVIEVRDPGELEQVLTRIARDGAHGVFTVGGTMFFANRNRLAEQALKSHLPMMCDLRAEAEAGCLMSYGASLEELFRRTAGLVDRILKGAQPNNLPVEQPTKFELVINLKTAKALGLTIPQSVLLRADQVIE